MLRKESPQLALTNAQSLGQILDALLVQSAFQNHPDSPGNHSYRTQPSWSAGGRLWAAPFAGTKASRLCLCGICEQVCILRPRKRHRADVPAIQTSTRSPGKETTVKARITAVDSLPTDMRVKDAFAFDFYLGGVISRQNMR